MQVIIAPGVKYPEIGDVIEIKMDKVSGGQK